MLPPQKRPQKMLSFLDSLHKKYKVLSKLTQKQSQTFDSEVVILLVDQNQCVDQKLYQEVIMEIGIDAFVLDVLHKSINRSPFTNQYELKKNISSIAQNLEMQTKELNKKMKVVQRRENQVNCKENTIKNRIKQFTIQLEKQLINKIMNKQTEIKKNISSLLNNVKAKQKIFCDRKQEINQKLAQLLNKQKSITIMATKQKQMSKKSQNNETQNLQADISQTVPKAMSSSVTKQLKQLSKKYEDTKSELEKLRKKYKTTEMAYSKIKNQVTAKQKENQVLSQKVRELCKQLEDQKNKAKLKDKQNGEKYGKDGFEENEVFVKNNKGFNRKFMQQINTINNEKIQKNTSQIIDMLEMLDISHIDHQQSKVTDFKQNLELHKKFESRQINEKFPKNSLPEIKEDKKKVVETFKSSIIIQKSHQQRYLFDNEEDQDQAEEQNEQVIVLGRSSIKNQKIENIKIKIQQNIANKAEKNKIILQKSKIVDEENTQNNEQSDEQSIQLPQFLKTAPTSQSTPNQLLTQLQNQLKSSKVPSQVLLQSAILQNFIRVPFFQQTKKSLTEYFDILLENIQQSNPNYYEIVNKISKSQFVQFFQKCYLAYEANLQIAQATTLLLSRILMMTNIQVKFQEDFVQAIRLRAKISGNSSSTTINNQDENQQFLRSNINCLLSMI